MQMTSFINYNICINECNMFLYVSLCVKCRKGKLFAFLFYNLSGFTAKTVSFLNMLRAFEK